MSAGVSKIRPALALVLLWHARQLLANIGSTSFSKSTGAGCATGAMAIPAGRVTGIEVGRVVGAARAPPEHNKMAIKLHLTINNSLLICVNLCPICGYFFTGC